MRRLRSVLPSLVLVLPAARAAAQAPTAETLKQVLTRDLLALRPEGYTERNVLFESVQAERASGSAYPFVVKAVLRDYGPGYPKNRYYGQTCVGRMDGWRFHLVPDDAGGWRAQGRMTVTDRTCVDNPGEGVSSQPLATLPGTPAGTGAAIPASPRGGGPSVGEWACYGVGGRRLFGFTLDRDGGYRDGDGKRVGTYSHSASAATLTFRGGAMDGQVGSGVTPNHLTLTRTVSCEPWR